MSRYVRPNESSVLENEDTCSAAPMKGSLIPCFSVECDSSKVRHCFVQAESSYVDLLGEHDVSKRLVFSHR